MIQQALGLSLEQARQELQARPLRASSAGRRWHGVAIDTFEAYDVDMMYAPPRDHHVVTVATGLSELVLQERCGRRLESPCHPGEATIIPAGHGGLWRGLLPAHVRMAISPEAVAEAADAMRKAGGTLSQMSNDFLLRDPLLRHYGGIFRDELDRVEHPAQDLVIASLATVLTTHLLRCYTNATGVEERSFGRADAAALRRAIDYMEGHDDGRVTLSEVAAAAGLSRFHFSRLFKSSMGISPIRYLERSRIERAKTLIRKGQLSLSQISRAIGFADQSHFTRRFKLWVGCTPMVYAREYGERLLPRDDLSGEQRPVVRSY